MHKITDRQQKILNFLRDCIRDEGYAPTMQEIAAHFGFRSINTVAEQLKALDRKGFINRRSGASRAISIIDDNDSSHNNEEHGIPIIGRVAAGKPITALENLEGYLNLSEVYGHAHFALTVSGDSMIDAGIWDGDYVIVREQPVVNNGEIGVAVVDGEATVKRINVKGAIVELIAENPDYKPIVIDVTTMDFRIAGKVVGIHRTL